MFKTMRRWTKEEKLELQACFDCTDWSVSEVAKAGKQLNIKWLRSYKWVVMVMSKKPPPMAP